MATRESSLQIPEIDGLRTFMVMGAMVVNFAEFTSVDLYSPDSHGGKQENLWRAILTGHGQFGYIGMSVVDLFFVMAGFFTVYTEIESKPMGLVTQLRTVAYKCGRLLPFLWMGHGWFVALAPASFQNGIMHTQEHRLTKLIIGFSGLQSWFPIIWHGTYLPLIYDGPLWFISSLMGAYLIFGFLGPSVRRFANTIGRNIALIIVFCVLRSTTILLAQTHSPLQGFKDSFFPKHWFWNPAHAGWFLQWPPCCALGFFAGALTAQLVKMLPEDSGVRTWRIWMLADLPIALLWLFGTSWSIGGKIPEAWKGASSTARFLGYDGPAWSSNQFHVFYCAFLLLTCCQHKGVFLQMCTHPTVTSFAPLSFAAYVFHFDVMMMLLNRGWALSVSGNDPSWIYLFFFTLTWYVAGSVVYYVEDPLRQLLRDWRTRSTDKDSTSSNNEYDVAAAESMLLKKEVNEETPLRQSV